jgi:hypothetical protein
MGIGIGIRNRSSKTDPDSEADPITIYHGFFMRHRVCPKAHERLFRK